MLFRASLSRKRQPGSALTVPRIMVQWYNHNIEISKGTLYDALESKSANKILPISAQVPAPAGLG